MHVVICEGENDVTFLQEIMKERFNMLIINKNLGKLQERLGTNCYKSTKNQYPLIIYGDNGKLSINTVLREVVVDTLGKNSDELHIIMIRDDDGAPYEILNVNLCKELQFLLRDKSKFIIHLPSIECNNDWFILKHPRSRGILKVKLSTVPSSLEKQVAKKTVEFRCPHDTKILNELETDPHKAIKSLADTYYGGDKDRLIRDSSILLKDETWVNDINSLVN